MAGPATPYIKPGFFGGVGADASEAEVALIAPKHPVFRIRAEGRASG
jgi:hypothetical protein